MEVSSQTELITQSHCVGEAYAMTVNISVQVLITE
ncbi:hypothetical protein Cal7507_1530 [Calothrix sp. PCC 7507]|nr:hypothetical protein Cal7507_1530 [Calothrix sp. PCC 7507]